METNSNQNTAALIHLSMLSQYMIPFGNFIFPAIIWSSAKNRSEFIDQQGKHALNFQLSLFFYALILCIIAVPVVFVTVLNNFSFSEVTNGEWIIENFNVAEFSTAIWFAAVAIIFFIMLKVAEFFLIIYAAVKTSNGNDFQYPLTIPFLK